MTVRLSRLSDDVAELRFDDAGGNGNRLTTADIRQLAEYLTALKADAPLITVLRHDGPDFTLGRAADPATAGDPAVFRLLSTCTDTWGSIPGLTVCAARGRIEGFGVGFVAQADIGVIGESSRLRFPEITHGFAPSVVIGWLIKRVAWQVQARWVLTGATIDPETALRHGLVGSVVPDGAVDAEADQVVEALLALDHPSLLECKRFAQLAVDAPAASNGAFAVDSLTRQFVERAQRSR